MQMMISNSKAIKFHRNFEIALWLNEHHFIQIQLTIWICNNGITEWHFHSFGSSFKTRATMLHTRVHTYMSTDIIHTHECWLLTHTHNVCTHTRTHAHTHTHTHTHKHKLTHTHTHTRTRTCTHTHTHTHTHTPHTLFQPACTYF